MARRVLRGIACRSRDALGWTDPPIVAGPALGTKTRGFRTVRTLLFGWLAGRSRGEAGLRARPGRSESAGRGAPLENSAPPPPPHILTSAPRRPARRLCYRSSTPPGGPTPFPRPAPTFPHHPPPPSRP